jgi:hypothetical protein
MIRMKGDHHARTPSCFAVADRLPYPNATQLRAWPWLPVPTWNPLRLMLGHAPTVDARNDGLTSRYRSPGRAKRRGEVRTLEARQASRGEVLDHYLGSLGHTE